MMEIFKDIKGYEGIYQVSNIGRVKSLNYNHTGKENILNPIKNNRGYLQVSLCINGKRKAYKIHRLVCETFLNNPENKKTVNHRNGIKTDNRLDNLEFATHSENHKHAYKELCRKGPLFCKFGKYHPKSKQVCRYTKSGDYIDEFTCLMEAERITNINNCSISSCCKGKLKSAGGYIWKYKNEKL